MQLDDYDNDDDDDDLTSAANVDKFGAKLIVSILSFIDWTLVAGVEKTNGFLN